MGSWNPPRHLIKIMSSRHLSRVNMGLDAMRPTYNLEPKYRVTVLIRENRTRGSGAPPEVKGLVWYADGSKMKEGTGASVFGQTVRRRLSFSLGRYTTVFQAKIYAIPACAHGIQSQYRSEKHVSICSDSQAALKALQAARTMSPLVRQCQEALNDISARHVVGFIGSLDMPEYKGMKSPMGWQGVALRWDFLDLSQSWGSLDGS